MNFMEAYEANKRGKDVIRKDTCGGIINFARMDCVKNKRWYSDADIEATNWEVRRKPMKVWEAIRLMLEEGKTVANAEHPGYERRPCDDLYLYTSELNTDTWYVVEEKEIESNDNN